MSCYRWLIHSPFSSINNVRQLIPTVCATFTLAIGTRDYKVSAMMKSLQLWQGCGQGTRKITTCEFLWWNLSPQIVHLRRLFCWWSSLPLIRITPLNDLSWLIHCRMVKLQIEGRNTGCEFDNVSHVRVPFWTGLPWGDVPVSAEPRKFSIDAQKYGLENEKCISFQTWRHVGLFMVNFGGGC